MATVEQCEKYKKMIGEPKPCPFCGSCEVDIFNRNLSSLANPAYCVFCNKCGAQVGDYKYKQFALDAWNTREGVTP